MDAKSPHEPTVVKTILRDVKQGGFFSQLKEEWRDITDFYIPDDKRDRLMKMGHMKRWLVSTLWIFKAMFMRLTPFRRILLIIGIVFAFSFRTSVDMGNRGGHFNVEAAPLLGMLAFLTVLALELKDKLLAKTELQAGRAVQRAMEPEHTPFIPGYDVWLFTRPANEVGGDLVDFMRLDHDRYAIVIGDVSGKGLGAALLMVKIQATIRALAPDYTSPAAFISKLNAILTRDHVPGSFTSLIFLNVSAASQAIRYVNAGHMPPLIISGTVVSESPKGDAALGLSGDTVYGENELLLRKGETVVLYSDGITEAQNEAGEFFGLDRFKALCAIGSDISAQAFGERIVGSVEGFIASARGTDDLSLVILRRSA